MTNNPPEQTRPGEFMTQNQPIALQMRLLIGSPEALNPTRTDLPQVDENALENLHATTRDDVLKKISISSTAESLNYWGQRIVTAAQQHVDLSNHQTQLTTWKTEMLQIMRNQTNQRHLNTLQQVHIGTGADQINFGALNDQEMQKLYDRYFKNTPQEINTVTFQVQGVEIKKVPAHIKKFADDVRAAHTDAAGTVDYTALQSHLESIGWLAKIFGPGSSEIIKELLQGEIKLQTDRTQFVGHANEDVNGTKRINFLNPRERHLLQVLQLSENGRLDTQAAPPGGDPHPTPDVEIDPNRQYQLDEIFQEIPGTFNPAHRFVVENPQDTLDFTDPELAQLGDDKKFFLDIVTQPNGLTTWKTNENVVPFTWELGTTSASPDQRFINGEKYTHNDSGLLALSAASTSTPENQAKLYRSYVDAILRAHKNSLDTNTDLSRTFLGKWLTSQGALDPAHLDSIAIFFSNDRDASQNPSVLRPENERLLDYDPHGNLKSNPEIVELWKNRIDELQTALQNNQLQSHHIRWIEFLSHSIDIQKLVDKAKSQPVPPTPSNTPPPGGRPGTPSAPPARRAPVTRSPTLRSAAAPPDPNLQHNPNQQPSENRSIEDAYRTYIGLVTLELPRAQQALADFEQTHQGITAWTPNNIKEHERLVQDVEKIEQYIRTANKEATDVEELVLKEMFSFTDTQTRTITGDALISPIYHELVESLIGYEFEALQGGPDLKLDKNALRTSLIKFNQKLIAQGLIQNPLFNNDVEQFISEHNSYRQKAYVVPKTI